jgi:hypothetical protein
MAWLQHYSLHFEDWLFVNQPLYEEKTYRGGMTWLLGQEFAEILSSELSVHPLRINNRNKLRVIF